MKTPLTLIHLGGVALIVVCAVVAQLVLKDAPVLQALVIGCATFLYGWLGFAPAKPVQEQIVRRMSEAEVERIQSSKPPAAPTVMPAPPDEEPPAP